MTKRTRPRRVKAVATVDYGPGYWDEKEGVYRIPSTPVWFVPRTAAAFDAMVRQLTVALFRDDPEPHWTKGNLEPYYEKLAIAALRAIGITRPKD